MDEQKLVDLIKVYPAIYDTSHPNHLKDDYTSLLWMDIAKQLDSTDEEIKTVWENIHIRYLREKRNLLKKKLEDPDYDPKSDWPLYESLKFLDRPQTIRIKKKVRICLTDKVIKTEELDPDAPSEPEDEEMADGTKPNKRFKHTHQLNFSIKPHQLNPRSNPNIVPQFDPNLQPQNFPHSHPPPNYPPNYPPNQPQNQAQFNPQDPKPDDEKDQDITFLRHILPMMRRMSVIDNLEFKFDVMQLMKSKLYPPHAQMGAYCCNYGYVNPVAIRISSNRKI